MSLATTVLAAGLLALLAAVVVLARRLDAEREQAARTRHEVRGPLTAVSLGLHGAARRGELAPTSLSALELEVRRAALALEDLLGEGPGTAAVEVDLDVLLDRQIATWAEVADAYGATLRYVPSPGRGGAVVRGEALRLAQALGNVLGNAIEHAGGCIEVRVSRESGRVRIEVADDGPGLPAPVAELVASRPRAGRDARGRGLSIASDVARRHGGRLVELPATRGTRLVLDLPDVPGVAVRPGWSLAEPSTRVSRPQRGRRRRARPTA